MKVSLIISIYKSPEFLEKVLASIAQQTRPPEEVIVSEDGEFEANRDVVYRWKMNWPKSSNLLLISQRDLGNRKPLAMNKALAAAEGDYLIFIDGDCVLRRDFVADHLSFSSQDCFLTGNRVELSPRASKFLTAEKIKAGYLEKVPVRLMWDSVFGHTKTFDRFFKVPFFLRKLLKKNDVPEIWGCNFSVHKKHLVAINGFSNDFSGAYWEDYEVAFRLNESGVKTKSIYGAAIQYHLWHAQQNKDLNNKQRYEDLMKSPVSRAPNGLAESAGIP